MTTLLMRLFGLSPREYVWFDRARAQCLRRVCGFNGGTRVYYRVPADAINTVVQDAGMIDVDQPDPSAVIVMRWEV